MNEIAMSRIRLKPVHSFLAAEVHGVDLTRPVPRDQFAEIAAAFDRHSVLVFPGQNVTDDQQVAFCGLFGPIEPIVEYQGTGKRRLSGNAVADLSNIAKDGEVWNESDERRAFNLANGLWHTDSSFKHVPALLSALSAREIPPDGGNTEFCDLRAAYDALPEARKRRLAPLVVEHSIFRSRELVGLKTFNPALMQRLPPVRQRLVRRHPSSGRMTLYIASHCNQIIGMPLDEGRQLLAELMEFATQPQFVYAHQWRLHDLVMWDNRCTMHRGRPYDDLKYRRDMHRVTISDHANTLEQPV